MYNGLGVDDGDSSLKFSLCFFAVGIVYDDIHAFQPPLSQVYHDMSVYTECRYVRVANAILT